jgi:hypothetical protein
MKKKFGRHVIQKTRHHIHYYIRVTLKTYLPVQRIGNKFLK